MTVNPFRRLLLAALAAILVAAPAAGFAQSQSAPTIVFAAASLKD
jgi:ABC-type molybdate transport system substrate-binding protein